MLSVKPGFNCPVDCPACSSVKSRLMSIHLTGIRLLAKIECPECQSFFYKDLPVGHALYYPIAFDKRQKGYGKFQPEWFKKSLKSILKNKSGETVVDIKVNSNSDKIIVLNCLDFLYGHVLLKLLNLNFYLNKIDEFKVVLIIPASFEWLVPQSASIAEVWLVNAGFSQLKSTWFKDLEDKFNHLLKRCSHVKVAPAYSHPPLKEVDISVFSKVPAFKIDNFNKVKPVVTFIYREDRLWHSNYLEYFLWLVAKKVHAPEFVFSFFKKSQANKIKATARLLQKKISEVEINVVGLGINDNSFKDFNDYRRNKLNGELEREWCEVYSRSHLVIGIHGSNMLLPSAHSAGFIEILPKERIKNFTQDLFCKYSGSKMLFLGRFLPNYSKPAIVAYTAEVIIKDYPVFDLYNTHSFDLNDDCENYERKLGELINKY